MKEKIIDRAVIVLINIMIIVAMAVGPALILASSPSYYRWQFEKNGIYSEETSSGAVTYYYMAYIGGERGNVGYFTDEQLDVIIDHIVDFLFGDTESFELVMDGVHLNGYVEDGVRVFGTKAVKHMDDVRSLMRFGRVASIVSAICLPFLCFYTVMRRRELGRVALVYTAMVFGALLLLLGGLCLVSLIFSNGDFFSAFWTYAHFLFFPFNTDKVMGSFFNDTLTMILTLDLFMDAVIIVLSTLAVAIAAWLTWSIILYRKYSTSAQ